MMPTGLVPSRPDARAPTMATARPGGQGQLPARAPSQSGSDWRRRPDRTGRLAATVLRRRGASAPWRNASRRRSRAAAPRRRHSRRRLCSGRGARHSRCARACSPDASAPAAPAIPDSDPERARRRAGALRPASFEPRRRPGRGARTYPRRTPESRAAMRARQTPAPGPDSLHTAAADPGTPRPAASVCPQSGPQSRRRPGPPRRPPVMMYCLEQSRCIPVTPRRDLFPPIPAAGQLPPAGPAVVARRAAPPGGRL